jgi:undecaprenyl-diphosphatase
MDLIHQLDAAVIAFAAGFARRVEAIDVLVVYFSTLELIKGGVLTALLAWLWFDHSPLRGERRVDVVRTLVAGLAAALLSRGIQNFLPPRPRPFNADPDFVVPYGISPDAVAAMQSWSSFPSDHAALYFALAAGIWLMHRRLGVFAMLWTLAAICAPRVYIGLHYASDILGGIVLAIVLVAAMRLLPERAAAPVLAWEKRQPGPFYAAAFLFCYELARMFWDVRFTARKLMDSATMLLG